MQKQFRFTVLLEYLNNFQFIQNTFTANALKTMESLAAQREESSSQIHFINNMQKTQKHRQI